MRLIDLSHEINSSMPVYPGDASPVFSTISNLATDGYIERRVTLSVHQGTHVDAPSHIIDNGKNIGNFPVSHFVGKACVISCTGESSGGISVESLLPFSGDIAQSDFVLLRTGWDSFWGSEKYFKYPALSLEAGVWLSGFKLKGVGIDAMSVDPVDSIDFPVHRCLLEREIVIVENLCCLDLLPAVGFEFFCLPLAFAEVEASPVRALAVVAKL